MGEGRSKLVRLGVVGAGGAMFLGVHAKCLAPGVRIAGVVEPSADGLARAEDALAGHGPLQAYDGLADLLRVEKPDAVLLASPPAAHAAQLAECLRAGVAVLVEKPLAIDDAGIALIEEAAGDSPPVVLAGFNGRFHRLYAGLRRGVASGGCGALRTLRMRFTTSPGPLPEWKRARASGGGALLDLGIHLVDLARWIDGAPVARAAAHRRSTASEDDAALLLLEFESGVVAEISCAFGTVEAAVVEAEGDAGALRADRYGGLVVERRGVGAQSAGARLKAAAASLAGWRFAVEKARHPVGDPSYTELHRRFARAVRRGRLAKDDPSLADGLEASRLVLLAERNPLSGSATP